MTAQAQVAFRIRIGDDEIELPDGLTELDVAQRDRVTAAEVLEATHIPDCFFLDCVNLASVDMRKAARLVSIGEKAFSGCNLLDVAVPDSVTHIASSAFSHNESLTHITLPTDLSHIPSGMCRMCPSLTSVIFPEKLQHIDERAFLNSDKLEARLPRSLRSFSDEAFSTKVPVDNMYPYVTCREQAPSSDFMYRCVTGTSKGYDLLPENAMLRMKLQANQLGATEVFNVKFSTSGLAYGLAVLVTGSVCQ